MAAANDDIWRRMATMVAEMREGKNPSADADVDDMLVIQFYDELIKDFPHLSPFGKTHAGPADAERHVGDLGNMVADASVVAKLEMKDSEVQLHGANSAVGRTIVVHGGGGLEDDLGRGTGDKVDESKTTGNAGARTKEDNTNGAGQQLTSRPQCVVCRRHADRHEALKRCTKCIRIYTLPLLRVLKPKEFFCSRRCLKQAWPTHDTCRNMTELSVKERQEMLQNASNSVAGHQ